MRNDTIAAIATGLSDAGISIIRVSGSKAFGIADMIFQAKKQGKLLSMQKSHTMHYGYIAEDGQILDEVLVSVMRAPHTYTAEDIIEINCHGGIIVTKKILQLILRHGARLAEPGEFTKRAFLNGRMDLSQAEAVMDLIHAKNERAVRNSVNQLRGSLLEKISTIRESILRDTAYIEAALDDPEHYDLGGFSEELAEHMQKVKKQLDAMIASAEDGRMIKEGIRTAIIGKPNVGKSSLLNLFAGEERAIVTEIAGTTRDTVEEMIKLRGICLHLIDTAGIRETEDIVEKIGVEKARKSAESADFILYVVDTSSIIDEEEQALMELIKDKKAIVLLNKSDLTANITKEELEQRTGKTVFSVSTKTGQGIEELYDSIEEMFFKKEITFDDEIMITSERQKEALLLARESIEKVEDSIALSMPEDFFSIDLMDAYTVLGTILGEEVDEDLINTIFKEFCMGK